VGTFSHALRGHVDLRLALLLLAGGAVSAQFGAVASRRLSGAWLGRIHALVILGAVAAVLWDLAAEVH
jgi:uncharacterized membrane protein YfcA